MVESSRKRSIRILRVAGTTPLLTAQVFEQLFERHLGGEFDVVRAPLEAFYDEVLGPAGDPRELRESARRFRAATEGVQFFCPNWEAIHFSPLFLALRNLSGAPTRLLFIAHAAGAYLSQWTLLAPLLRPGDVIITPSASARRTVEFLAPDLGRFLNVVSHPMAPLAAGSPSPVPRIVSLGRVLPRKLVHRQIEAMAVLRARGHRRPVMEIGGPLDDDPSWPGIHPYCRGLQEKIGRLGLAEQVRLVGPVRGDDRKAAFLSSASLLVNLSMTLEESFPKTPVEALGVGVPVLGTSWNGLRDTVGPCGQLLPLSLAGRGEDTLDISAESVADGIERLLAERPSPAECRAWVEQFRPEVAVPRYRLTLERAWDEALGHDPGPQGLPGVDVPAVPRSGLLAQAMPINQYGWRELFDQFVRGVQHARHALATGALANTTGWESLRRTLHQSLQSPLERFFAGLPLPVGCAPASPGREAAGPKPDPVERLVAAAIGPGLPSGRIACLRELSLLGRHDLLSTALDKLESEPASSPAVDHVRVQLRAECQAAAGDLEGAVKTCLAGLRAAEPLEHESRRVRQLADLARRWRRPQLAIPWLAAWLDRFPDAPDSGPTWLDLSVTAARAGRAHFDQAAAALARARLLLGPVPVVLRAERIVAGAGPKAASA
jgi:glycosyltransferase involved in cell wall biosynthesis